jgi:type IV pilus assembly protein PilX
MNPIKISSPKRGVVLVIALIMLVIISVLSVSTIRTTIQEEKMAGNSRDRDRALQAAEAAIQYCIAQVNAGSLPVSALIPVDSGTPNWDVATNWTDSTKSAAVTLPTDSGVSSNPRCLIEGLGVDNYRVTARAVGGSDTTIVILQATYTKE